MIRYYISESKQKFRILRYLFENKNNVMKSIFDGRDITNFEMQKECCNDNDTNQLLLGYGEHIFKFMEKDISIEYREEGTPNFGVREIKYFTRLIISADNSDIIETFIEKTNEIGDSNEKNIFITDDYGEWIKYNKIPQRNLDTIYINKKIKDKIVHDIQNFIDTEKDYDSFGIPYKITFLLSGIPGSGKTSLIKAICKKFHLNLCVLSFSKKFDNTSLLYSIKNLKENSILLIEDIDCLFNKRNATDDNPLITFSNLLNILDGMLYKHGCIIFLTTNHPEKLDHALLRIGRIDSIFELNYPQKNDIKHLFCDLLKDNEKIEEHFNTFYESIRHVKISMSSIVNFLFKYKHNWKENIDELLNNTNYINKCLGNENKDLLFS